MRNLLRRWLGISSDIISFNKLFSYLDSLVRNIENLEKLTTRVSAIEENLKESLYEPDALFRIAECLERAFPIVSVSVPIPSPRPSDLANLTTVTAENVDEKTRFWKALARRYGIAPDSDLFQELILHYEESVVPRTGAAPEEIDWDQVFGKAAEDLGEPFDGIPEEAGAEAGSTSKGFDGEPTADIPIWRT